MRKTGLLFMILFLAGAFNSIAQVEPPVGKRWITVSSLTDDFEGTTVNTNKWTTDHNVHPVLVWPGRPPAVFHPDKVTVDSGRVTIEVGKLPEPMVVFKYGRNITYEYYGGCIRGFTPVKTGMFFECEAKMNKTEMGGGFWMAGRPPCGKVHEIDITESVGRITSQTASWAKDWDYIMHSNSFYKKSDCSEQVQTSNKINLPTKNHERFYRYGFWWKSPKELLFYVDGEYAYSIEPPNNADHELYLQYDIEAYDWNPFPSDGGRVTNGSLEERTTHLNYIHTFKMVDVDDPNESHPQEVEIFNIYSEELLLSNELSILTADTKLSIPLTYKTNEDREIHLRLVNGAGTLVGEALGLAYAGYANMVFDFILDSVPAAGIGYTLVADIRPINTSIADAISVDSLSIELKESAVVTILVKDEATNSPLQDVTVTLKVTSKLSDAEGLAVFSNVSADVHELEISKEGYLPIENMTLQTFKDTLITKHLSQEIFTLLFSFIDITSSARIENAEVAVNDSTQITGSSGRVIFTVPEGKYKLNLKHKNYLYCDSLDVSHHQVELFKLKKSFSDFYVTVNKDDVIAPGIDVAMGDSTRTTDAKGSITFPLLKIDSVYNYKVIEDMEILKEDSVQITENGLLTVNIPLSAIYAGSGIVTMSIYPNPAQEKLWLSEEIQNSTFRIFNIKGAEVMSGRTTHNFISVKTLQNGIYFLKLEGSTLIRFIKA